VSTNGVTVQSRPEGISITCLKRIRIDPLEYREGKNIWAN